LPALIKADHGDMVGLFRFVVAPASRRLSRGRLAHARRTAETPRAPKRFTRTFAHQGGSVGAPDLLPPRRRSGRLSDPLAPQSLAMPRLRSRRAAQQAFGAEVFIYVGPVDPISAAGDLPMGTLRDRGVQEARIPPERHRDRAPVHQTHGQRILGEPHVCHSFAR